MAVAHLIYQKIVLLLMPLTLLKSLYLYIECYEYCVKYFINFYIDEILNAKVFTEILVIIFIISGGVYPEQKLLLYIF